MVWPVGKCFGQFCQTCCRKCEVENKFHCRLMFESVNQCSINRSVSWRRFAVGQLRWGDDAPVRSTTRPTAPRRSTSCAGRVPGGGQESSVPWPMLKRESRSALPTFFTWSQFLSNCYQFLYHHNSPVMPMPNETHHFFFLTIRRK